MKVIKGNISPFKFPYTGPLLLKRSSLQPWGVLFGVLLISGLYLSIFVPMGWVPDDEGLLCQQAVRCLQGELPHRDFHETYTGGLTVMSAWAFKLGGINALSLRYMLLGFCLLTLASVFEIMRRVTSLWGASLVTLITLSWSFPNAFSGLPSWYVICFWCLGVYFIERHRAGRREGHVLLAAAGACGGLSVLMKISGIFFLGAAVLHLCHVQLVDPRKKESLGEKSAFILGPLLIGLILLLHLGGTIFLFSRLPTSRVFINLILPNLAVDIYLGGRLMKASAIPLRPLSVQISFLLLGFFSVLLPPLFWFLRFSNINTAWTGVFVRPAQRTLAVTSPFPDVSFSGWGLLVGLMVAAGLRVGRSSFDKRLAWILVFLLTTFLVMSDWAGLSQVVLMAMRLSPPFLVFVLLFCLGDGKKSFPTDQRVSVFIPVVFLSLCSLIQFPSAYISYFFYITPFVWMLLGRVVSSSSWHWPRSGLVFGIFFVLFGAIVLNPAPFLRKSFEAFDLPRASLAVPSNDKKIWCPLVHRIQSLVPNNKEPIFAGPDSPEIYFLADRPNPTKILYEILENQDSLERDILEAIRKTHCRIVVVNLRPVWSKPFSRQFHIVLRQHFGVVELFDHFLLYSNISTQTEGS